MGAGKGLISGLIKGMGTAWPLPKGMGSVGLASGMGVCPLSLS